MTGLSCGMRCTPDVHDLWETNHLTLTSTSRGPESPWDTPWVKYSSFVPEGMLRVLSSVSHTVIHSSTVSELYCRRQPTEQTYISQKNLFIQPIIGHPVNPVIPKVHHLTVVTQAPHTQWSSAPPTRWQTKEAEETERAASSARTQ